MILTVIQKEALASLPSRHSPYHSQTIDLEKPCFFDPVKWKKKMTRGNLVQDVHQEFPKSNKVKIRLQIAAGKRKHISKVIPDKDVQCNKWPTYIFIIQYNTIIL